MRTNLSVAVLVLSAVVLAGCGSGSAPATTATKEITSQRAGDLMLSLQNENGELAQGQNRFVVAFRSANNQPVDPGNVTIGASMTMPGMAPMVAEMEVKPSGTPGAYAATGDFKMSGAYVFEVRWDGPAGKGSTSFTTSVR